jgi:OOP family OmpA-OmpF porin
MDSLSFLGRWCDLGGRALAVGLFAIGLVVGVGQSTAFAADTELNIERFEASPHSGDMLMLRTAEDPRMRSFKGWSGGLFLTYGKDPLRVIDNRFPGKTVFEVVDHQLVGDLFGAYAPWKWLSVGLNLPIALYAGGESGFQNAGAADGVGLGDVRLSAKFLVIPRRDEGFGLAIEPTVSIPTATANTYAGDAGVTFTPRIIADYKFDETTLVANLGYRLRGTQSIGPYEIGSDIQMGLGVRQGFLEDRLRVVGELLAGSSQEDFFGESGTNMEGQIGANYCVAGISRVYLAGGGGFLTGIGDPSLRLTAGARFESCGKPEAPQDRDGDGIYDEDDACVDTPGVAHDDDDKNGCPPDRDGDGIIDAKDACPDDPGKAWDDPAWHGCPDRDGDGILDKDDACPDDKGKPSEKPEEHGCPDTDGDGIIDKQDACPAVKGLPSDKADEHGCPDRDNDKIRDLKDACPDVAGEPNEDPKRHGCPMPKLTKEKIEIIEKVEFEVDKDVLLSESTKILDEVAAVILNHPEITQVIVEGHTDNTATPSYNLKLSNKRAKAVRKYLIDKGVAGKILKSKGFGQSKPIATNDTVEGRQTNRRVEFKVFFKKEGK